MWSPAWSRVRKRAATQGRPYKPPPAWRGRPRNRACANGRGKRILCYLAGHGPNRRRTALPMAISSGIWSAAAHRP